MNGNLKKMLAEIYGKKNGCSKGHGGSMHLIDLNVNFMGSTAIVGNSLPIGAGLALTIRIENSNPLATKKRNLVEAFAFAGADEAADNHRLFVPNDHHVGHFSFTRCRAHGAVHGLRR